MSQNISLWGASYSNVPSVTLPKTGGGSATFTDVTDTTATASDVASGKYFYTAAGTKTQGTGTSGGGLEYETGTWTPSANVANTTISLSNTHTVAPFFYMITDAEGEYFNPGVNRCLNVTYFNNAQVFGAPFYVGSGASPIYGQVAYAASNNSSLSRSALSLTSPYTDSGASSTSYPRHWATETTIRAYTNNSSRYWIAGKTYKWVAVWTPTT